MPKTKISEYSATANSNTDVASINIDEGCAPSGINNAIRAVMGHLKDFQTGAAGDPVTVGDVLTVKGASINDTNGNELFKLTATASAVNELTVANAATGGSPTISATGGDTNVGINLTPKGTGGIVFPAGAVATPAITTSGDLNTGVYFPAADTVGITTGGIERARTDSSGNFIVGTSATSGTRLRVQGASSSSSDFSLYCTNSSSVATLYARNDGAIFTGSSGSGLGACPYNNTTASAANMVIGTGGDLQRSTSALKYKQDVRDLETIDINKFRAVRYKSKCENDDQSKDYFGLIADEVHDAGVVELVNYGADGEVEGFQYERLTVVLLKNIQEQQAIITQLQADVAALKGQ